MLRWGQAIEAVAEIAVPDDFSVYAHQLLAEAMIVMWAQQFPVDPVTLRAHMEREHPRTALWGGPGYLIELNHVATELVPHGAEHHARLAGHGGPGGDRRS
jgi:replicative DNA helicase